MSLVCQAGGQGTALTNGTCSDGQDYCFTLHPNEGTKKGQKAYGCAKKSDLSTFKYTITPKETLTCQTVYSTKKVEVDLCVCTKDLCNYGSVLKVSKRNHNFFKSLTE